MRVLKFLLVWILVALPARAHDIPGEISIHMFVKPAGKTLRVLIRVPLASINDVSWPFRHGNGELLDISRADPRLRDAANLWLADFIKFYEGDRQLAYPALIDVIASLPSDQSFATYEQALAHVTGPPLPDDTTFMLKQGLLDVLYEYSIQSDQSRFSFDPDFSRLGLRVVTALRFLPPGGEERAFEYAEGDPGLVRFNPSWYEAAGMFLRAGAARLIEAADALLLLVCLVLPYRRLRDLLPVIAAFILASSITLVAFAFNLAPEAQWFGTFVSTCAALAIIYLAVENVLVERPQRRWQMASAFGLIEGAALSAELKGTLQFAGAHPFLSVLAFDLGTVIAQLAVIALSVLVLTVLFRYVVAERLATIVISGLAAHTAWHWMSVRYALLARYRFEWPTIDAAFLASVMRWAMLVVALAASAWVVSLFRQRNSGSVRL